MCLRNETNLIATEKQIFIINKTIYNFKTSSLSGNNLLNPLGCFLNLLEQFLSLLGSHLVH